MKYFLYLTALIGTLAFTQPPPPPEDMGELKDTLRFIRLAESRKSLSFTEDKLLKVNEILDDIEAKRIDLGKKERLLKLKSDQKDLSEDQARNLLQHFRAVRKEQSELDLALFDRVNEVLTPLESIEFFSFYAEFRKKMARQVNLLRQNRRPNKRRPNP